MSSRVAIRVLGTALGVFFLVSSARAGIGFTNFEECADPSTVWDTVLGTIFDDGSLLFGNLDTNVCTSITKKGVSLCKSQTKLAQKCNDKTFDTLSSILQKQCAQAEDPEERSACKTGIKQEVKAGKDDNKANRESGIGACETVFADDLQQACELGFKM